MKSSIRSNVGGDANIRIQPTSAKICGICGRLFLACFTNTGARSTQRLHEEHKAFFTQRHKECLLPANFQIQPASAEICGICGRQSLAGLSQSRKELQKQKSKDNSPREKRARRNTRYLVQLVCSVPRGKILE
jgi:hypothetical protein